MTALLFGLIMLCIFIVAGILSWLFLPLEERRMEEIAKMNELKRKYNIREIPHL